MYSESEVKFNMATVVNKAVQPLDSYLKFIQDNFNVESGEPDDIVKLLSEVANSKANNSNEARGLLSRFNQQAILKNQSKYSNIFAQEMVNNKGILSIIRITDNLLKDINKAQEWLKDYSKFKIEDTGQMGDLQSELVLLGQAILMRAIELCPMRTGALRKSGILIEYSGYVVIMFTAPYAYYVHENLEIAHPHHPSNPNCGGRAKFLEIAMQEFYPQFRVWAEQIKLGGVGVKIMINPRFR